MKKDTREIICAIYIVGSVILAVLGYWYLGFIFVFFYLFLPKTKEQKAELLWWKMIEHVFKKRDWKDKKKIIKEVEKEFGEMDKLADEIEKE